MKFMRCNFGHSFDLSIGWISGIKHLLTIVQGRQKWVGLEFGSHSLFVPSEQERRSVIPTFLWRILPKAIYAMNDLEKLELHSSALKLQLMINLLA